MRLINEQDRNRPVYRKYTLMELGITDLEKITHALHLCRQFSALTEKMANWEALKEVVILRSNFMKTLENNGYNEEIMEELFKHISDAEYLNKFLNTLAYNMLIPVRDLHRINYVHRDIKPDNFCLFNNFTNGTPKLEIKLIDSDMIVRNVEDEKKPNPFCLRYASPEKTTGTKYENEDKVAHKAILNDAYSLGMSLKMIYGHSKCELDKIQELQTVNGKKATQDITKIKKVFEKTPKMATTDHVADLLINIKPEKRFRISSTNAFAQDGITHIAPNFKPESMLTQTEWQSTLRHLVAISSVISDEFRHEYLDPHLHSNLQNPLANSKKVDQVHYAIREIFKARLELENELKYSKITDPNKFEKLKEHELKVFAQKTKHHLYTDILGPLNERQTIEKPTFSLRKI